MARYQDLGVGVLRLEGQSQTIDHSQFTDGTSTSGYLDLRALPASALVLGWKAVVTEAFTGNSSAAISVGVSGDTDKYSAVTDLSVYAIGTVSASVANDANVGVQAAQTPRVTVTGGSDFTNITAGKMTLTIYYISME